MDKMKFETPDIIAENIVKLADIFPGVVVEGAQKRQKPDTETSAK